MFSLKLFKGVSSSSSAAATNPTASSSSPSSSAASAPTSLRPAAFAPPVVLQALERVGDEIVGDVLEMRLALGGERLVVAKELEIPRIVLEVRLQLRRRQQLRLYLL